MERPNAWRKKYYEEFDDIDVECRERMKIGQSVYREGDITERLVNLMGRDLIEAAIEELFDTLNYARSEIIKLRHIQAAIANDSAIERVNPSGKPKLQPGNEGCRLTA